jgi:2-polyprenyl-3-methyl-5-hydroxy-6-metoxy-1,4-benzoquinol methylase
MESHEYEVMHAEEVRHWWFRGRRRIILDRLRGIAGARILDYGCGTGGNSSAYSMYGSVIGIEPDSTAVRLARARGGAQYCRASGTELPFRHSIFDVVVASDVLEHIENDSAAVSEIVRVLRPGGAAIISVPAHQWLFSEHDAALHHHRRYSKALLRNLLEHGGLRIRRLSYWNAALFPVIGLYRLVRKPPRTTQPRSDTHSLPWLVNEALTMLLAAEAAVLRHAPLPWGVSLLAVAERV